MLKCKASDTTAQPREEKSGSMAQSVARLTADTGVAGLNPSSWRLIMKSFLRALLPLSRIENVQLSVTGDRCAQVLIRGLSIPKKSKSKPANRLIMALTVLTGPLNSTLGGQRRYTCKHVVTCIL